MFSEMQRAMEQWDEQEKANADALEQQIEALSLHGSASPELQDGEFWARAKEISSIFKTLRPLQKTDQDRLWARFSRICEEMKVTQEQEREYRRDQSSQKRNQIEAKIEEVHSLATSAEDVDGLSKAKGSLDELLAWLRNDQSSAEVTEAADTSAESSSSDEASNEVRLLREDRQACWVKWREVNDIIQRRRQEMWDSNYHELKTEAAEALKISCDGNPYDGLAAVREIQENMRAAQMSKSQREEIRQLLNDAWEKSMVRVNEVSEERKIKHQEWLDRMEGHLERWTDLMRKNEDVIARLEDQIHHLEEEANNARTDEYAERVQGWIGEKRQKIKDIQETNRGLEEKINSVKDRIAT